MLAQLKRVSVFYLNDEVSFLDDGIGDKVTSMAIGAKQGIAGDRLNTQAGAGKNAPITTLNLLLPLLVTQCINPINRF